MEYTITKPQRNGIILSSCFLILSILIRGLLFLINTPTKIELAEQLIWNTIYLIPFGYLMLVFYKYLKHYQRKVLQGSILLIFAAELILKSTLFSNLFESPLKKVVLLGTSTIWLIATVVLLVGLLRNTAKTDQGMLAIRNYAICSLLIYLFATTHSFYLASTNPLQTRLLVGLTSAIPFSFTIVFAMKLKLKA